MHLVFIKVTLKLNSFSRTCLFVCLIDLGLSSLSRIFYSYGDVTFTNEGLQILTYPRHSWPLSSEGSLACHTYCDMGHPFIIVISENQWHSHLCRAFSSGTVTFCFYDLGLLWLGFEHPTFHLRNQRSKPLRPRLGHWKYWNHYD